MRIELEVGAMDTERLRNLAASYRLRASKTDNEAVRIYENDMACYLDSVAAWVEARREAKVPESKSVPASAAAPDRV
jgi:hypothetical protein